MHDWVVINRNNKGEVIEDLSTYPVSEEFRASIDKAFHPDNWKENQGDADLVNSEQNRTNVKFEIEK